MLNFIWNPARPVDTAARRVADATRDAAEIGRDAVVLGADRLQRGSTELADGVRDAARTGRDGLVESAGRLQSAAIEVADAADRFGGRCENAAERMGNDFVSGTRHFQHGVENAAQYLGQAFATAVDRLGERAESILKTLFLQVAVLAFLWKMPQMLPYLQVFSWVSHTQMPYFMAIAPTFMCLCPFLKIVRCHAFERIDLKPSAEAVAQAKQRLMAFEEVYVFAFYVARMYHLSLVNPDDIAALNELDQKIKASRQKMLFYSDKAGLLNQFFDTLISYTNQRAFFLSRISLQDKTEFELAANALKAKLEFQFQGHAALRLLDQMITYRILEAYSEPVGGFHEAAERANNARHELLNKLGESATANAWPLYEFIPKLTYSTAS